MNYKATLILLVATIVIVGINLVVLALAQDSEARSTLTWEGDCAVDKLVKVESGVALQLTCEDITRGDFNVTTANPDVILYGNENPKELIHCKIYRAGNNDCRPAEEGST